MENIRTTHGVAFRLVQWAVAISLLGRGLLYIWWDGPLRNLLWDESVLSPLVTALGWTWSEWVTSLSVERGIQTVTTCVGRTFVLLAIATLGIGLRERWAKFVLPVAAALSLLHVGFDAKNHFGQLGYLVEMSLQWSAPLLLLLLYRSEFSRFIDYVFRVAIALTFVGHGLYAIGFYPIPGNFQDMMMSGFGLERSSAMQLLQVVGALDFVAALLLLVPAKRWALPGLYYIIIWGTLTAFARIWSYLGLFSTSMVLSKWVPEMALRTVHFMIPLALLFLWRKKLSLNRS